MKSFLYSVPAGVALASLAMQSSSPFEVIAPERAASISPDLATLVKDTKLAQSNPPPPPKNPGSSSPGGRRDPVTCSQDAIAATTDSGLTALSPTTKPGITLAERPTFLVFVPKTSAKTAEFSLRDRSESSIYRTTLTLTNIPGIVSISLPAQAPPLEIGKQYLWSFSVICNPDDRLDDRFVTGTVQRLEFDPARLRQIQQAPPKEQVSLYQKASAWYDTLAVLYKLKGSQMSDSSITNTWRELLQSGGVNSMIDSN